MILETRDLAKSFHQGSATIEVLNKLNFSIQAGETLAIVGPSGSGKSTLLSLLAGLDAPSSGQVIVKDQDLNTLPQRELTDFRGRHIGIIFQQFHLMPHLTALENVKLPLDIFSESDALARAKTALDQVGLSHRANHTPSELSGGECQRVAIARAFVANPSLLLADEPSGNLDTHTGESVMDLLFKMVNDQNMTMILVTHNMDLANRCNRQLVLESVN